MHCSRCNEKINLGECYGNGWCSNCEKYSDGLDDSFVNVYVPGNHAIYQYKLNGLGMFKFNKEISSPEMNG